MKEALLVDSQEAYGYHATADDRYVVLKRWGSSWTNPGEVVGMFDMDNLSIIKAPDSINEMEALVKAVKMFDPNCFDEYDVFVPMEKL